jgi:hypothetical protein
VHAEQVEGVPPAEATWSKNCRAALPGSLLNTS